MLNFKVNVQAEKIEYPIYFEKKNTCIHCGKEGSLVLIDAFGRETKQEIHPFDHIKCTACGRKYSIKWNIDESNNSKMYPVAVEREIKQEFINLIKYPFIKDEGVSKV